MLRRLSVSVVLGLLVGVLVVVGCGKKPFSTPESTLERYVEAYNEGDRQAMAQCGNDVDVRKIFMVNGQNILGEDVLVPVKGIKFKVISVNQRPRATISNYFLTEDAWIEAEFTSEENPNFHKVATVRLVNRMHSYYIEEPHWQLVPLSGD